MAKIRTYERRAGRKNGALRFVFTAISFLLEVGLLLLLVTRLWAHALWINSLLGAAALALVLGIYSQNKTSSVKMPWILLIVLLPVPGITLYLLTGLNGHTRKMLARYRAVDERLLPLLQANTAQLDALAAADSRSTGVARYLCRYSGYPVYGETALRYFDRAADALEAQLADLAGAERFIFLEYHAIEDADSWRRVQTVLEDRVRAGVEVRVFYDDLGSIFFINSDFSRKLEAAGIRCRAFNRVSPGLNLFLNNRDHRKITVIDGRIGYTGGYNLANEYFGLTAPYGEWKDTGLRLEGEAVRSMIVSFLEMWDAVEPGELEGDAARFLPPLPDQAPAAGGDGLVQPYADSPMDGEHVGENVYISLVESAGERCWFMTPYLIITDEMTHALGLAAKKGVDVRIITPGIPDKKLIYSVTRSYYAPLVRQGVRIFEWTPGFCHAKMCLVDRRAGTCGTINLDYRSLYHHFENGCVLYGGAALEDMEADFLSTLSRCREVTEDYRKSSLPGPKRLAQLVLRLFAALL